MTSVGSGGAVTGRLFTRYVVAGIWNTAFGYVAFAGLVAAFSPRVHYLLLAVAAHVAAITNAFLVHKFGVFRTRGGYLREYLRYYVVYGGSAIASLALLAVFVGYGHLNVYLAQAIVLAIQTAVSFVGHRRFSFAPREPR